MLDTKEIKFLGRYLLRNHFFENSHFVPILRVNSHFTCYSEKIEIHELNFFST